MNTKPITVEDVYPLHAVPASVLLVFFFLMLAVVAPRLDDHSADFFDVAMIEEDQRQLAFNAACAARARALCGGDESSFRPGRNGKTQCLDKRGRPTITLERIA